MEKEKKTGSKEDSPETILDHDDPGDKTQRNFRYQHGYGVILLVAAASKQKPYTAIWCEHFDDFLCKRVDQSLDAYQIKTRKPESGPWVLTNESLRWSIKKFTRLVSRFKSKIADLYFVSNANFLDSEPNISRQKLCRSPVKFLEAVRCAKSVEEIPESYSHTFEYLREYCDCSKFVLYTTLSKLHLVVGPGRDSFDAEIIDDHLAKLPECAHLPVPILDDIRDELLKKISFASSRRIDNPRKHWIGLDEDDSHNPILLGKKLPVEVLYQTIKEVQVRSSLTLFIESAAERSEKDTIFLSHGGYGDNEFVSWLALRLISEGYSVWNNLISLKGGENHWDEVQRIISQKAAIFLYVLSNNSNIDQESLKELKLAYDHMQSERQGQFVVPLELEKVPQGELNFLFSGLQRISFTNGWANGFAALLDRLDPIHKNSNSTPATANAFWVNKFAPQAVVKPRAEEYYSNWFHIQLPQQIYIHHLSESTNAVVETGPYPALQQSGYLISFAKSADFSSLPGLNITIESTSSASVSDFLQDEVDHPILKDGNAWYFMTRLLNLSWIQFMGNSGLGVYELSNGQLCYYFHMNFGGDKVFFEGVNRQRTWRTLMGYRTFETQTGVKEKRYWHFAIEGKPMLHPEPFYLIKSHVLFSDDGYNVWDSKARLHVARRSWCKDWWNETWRDRLLASMSFMADSKPTVEIAVGSDVFVDIDFVPFKFISPVTYSDLRDQEADLADDQEMPVIDIDEDDDYDESDDEWEDADDE